MISMDRIEANIIRIPMAGCWLWTGSLTDRGYGQLHTYRKFLKMHHVSYELFKGPVPPDLCVLHHCDVRCCINPDHLFLGTIADNNNDRDKKGRFVVLHGTLNGRTKLTEEQVLAIRSDTRSLRKIAAAYNISFSQVHNIKQKVQWKRLT